MQQNFLICLQVPVGARQAHALLLLVLLILLLTGRGLVHLCKMHFTHHICPDTGASLRGSHRRKQKRGSEHPVKLAKSAKSPQQPGVLMPTLCCCCAAADADASAEVVMLLLYLPCNYFGCPAISLLPDDCC